MLAQRWEVGTENEGSDWGHHRRIPIIDYYQTLLKPNTKYNITISGNTNTDLDNSFLNLQLNDGTEITNWDIENEVGGEIKAGIFSKNLFLTTNSVLNNTNQQDAHIHFTNGKLLEVGVIVGTIMAFVSNFNVVITEE